MRARADPKAFWLYLRARAEVREVLVCLTEVRGVVVSPPPQPPPREVVVGIFITEQALRKT
eukprot:scaffold2058_cov69-Phaeocystis_antarctica.AAC.13